MNAVWFRFRAELRTRWRAWLSLALLLGVAAGAVIALAAGANRTDSAYSRFLRRQRAYDAAVILPAEDAAPELVALALLIGLPLGIAAGRTAWVVFADDLGVVAEPWFPVLAVALMVPLAVLVANLVAAVPAWVAARTRPAAVLRSE